MKVQKIRNKNTHVRFTEEEKQKYYDQVKKSAHVFRNRKKYRREEKHSAYKEYSDDKTK